MKSKIALVLLLSSIAMAESSALDPNDIPFVYDPNRCKYPVIDWVEVDPNITTIVSFGIHTVGRTSPDVWIVNADANNLAVIVMPTTLNKFDANSVTQYFQLAFTPPRIEKIYYLNIKVTKPEEDSTYNCTVLVKVKAPAVQYSFYVFLVRRPELLPRQSFARAGQLFVQWAEKVHPDFILTKPVNVYQ